MKKKTETLILLGSLAVTVIIFGVLSDGKLFSKGTIQTFGFQLPEFALLTLGMMITIITGGINLSIVSTSALSAILAATILQQADESNAISMIILAIAVCLLSAMIMGSINGALISLFNVPPMVITLGTATMFEGISLNITKGGAISGYPDEFFVIGTGKLLGIPVPLIILAVVIVIFYLALQKTGWGERIYIVGSNSKVSSYSGIDNKKVLFSVYIISGLFSGLAAIIMTSRYNSAKVDFGASYLLQTVTASVLGGTSITGGFGKVSGVVIGVIIIQIITTGFSLLGINSLYTNIIIGIVLIAVVTASTLGSFGRAKLEPIKSEKKDLPQMAK